jgi:hypothetical protein
VTESASPIRRFSSRRQKLAQSFLAEQLRGAKAYDRIAGYFCSSILETAGEALHTLEGAIRVVCNSGVQPQEVATARAAAAALRQEWCASRPETLVEAGGEAARRRFGDLYAFLSSFSQYYDSVRWLAEQLTGDLPGELVGVYAGSGKSGIWAEGRFTPAAREDIKQRIRRGEIRLLLGTDAASEGLNLQRLGTLINLDLPWNPTRLEQRKGRIQRIGQLNDTVHIYNLRYLGSVEDRVHQLLSSRLQDIYTLFGQLPDVLEDVWIDVALGETERARRIIDAVPRQHPFDVKYQRISKIDRESCERVLASGAVRAALSRGW